MFLPEVKEPKKDEPISSLAHIVDVEKGSKFLRKAYDMYKQIMPLSLPDKEAVIER